MNAVGIDVSKGKSTVAIMRPFGEIVKESFEIAHTTSDLKQLTTRIKSLEGETRIIMEYTGKYYQPVVKYLADSGLHVSVVHAKLLHDYGNNSIRKVKTDKADAMKIANYGLANWPLLKPYTVEDAHRLTLKSYNRQYENYSKQRTALKNNLISLLDQTFPGINHQFTSPSRADGHEKWIDFCEKFWHCKQVSKCSLNQFTKTYHAWCKRNEYQPNDKKAAEIHAMAKSLIPTLPAGGMTKPLIQIAVAQLNANGQSLECVKKVMHEIASSLPEFPVVRGMYGVGDLLASQLIAEIGDVRRFEKRNALIAFAGVDAPPFQSGNFESKSRKISKKGSAKLRKELFLVMRVLIQTKPDDPIYHFIDRKRAEGKNYGVYMMAGCNKFLRIYYAKVRNYLKEMESSEEKA